MLTGDNGILVRAGQAKEAQERAQIIEETRTELLEKIAEKLGKNLTSDEIKEILAKYFNGTVDDLTDLEQTLTTKMGGYTVKLSEILDGLTIALDETSNDIKLSVKEIETESKAVILEVTVDGIDLSDQAKEAWLRTLSTDELKEIYAQASGGIGKTWAQSFNGAPFSDVKEYYDFTGTANSGVFADEYDWMIKSSNINNNNLNILYLTANNITETEIKCGKESQVIDYINTSKAEFVITTNGQYSLEAKDLNDKTGITNKEVTKCKVERFSNIQEHNLEMTVDNYKVVIPAGFAYGISENIGHVTTGLVISDHLDNSGNSDGNEFVWIPIETETVSGVEKIKVGKTNNLMARLSTGSYAGKDSNNNDNYEGVLYKASGNTYRELSETYGQNTNGIREPAYLNNVDNKTTYNRDASNNEIVTQEILQKNYNTMIASIKRYGGFYVARYEMGKNAYSKLNVEPTTAAEDETKTWYGLYSKSKNYNKPNNFDSINSGMMWGSQYSALFNFAISSGNDADKVFSKTNGNHSGEIANTGITKSDDSINNIYDLEGNLVELSQLSNGTFREFYGGGYKGSLFNVAPSAWAATSPTLANEIYGSRIYLSIK